MSDANERKGDGSLDGLRSLAAAEGIGAVVKECYRNATLALIRDADIAALPGVRYVEGWALYHDTGLPVEHGWLEYQGEAGPRVIDPTCVLLFGIEAGMSYFPAHYYTRDVLRRGARWAGALPIWHETHGWTDPDMAAARERAWREAGLDTSHLRRKGEPGA
jgi:hypothetical protein